MAEKTRVFELAKELSVDSKTILTKCQAEGIELKNHMSTLSAGLAATIREWFSEAAHATASEVSERIDLEKVRKKTSTRKRKKPDEEEVSAESAKTDKVKTRQATHAGQDTSQPGAIAVLENEDEIDSSDQAALAAPEETPATIVQTPTETVLVENKTSPAQEPAQPPARSIAPMGPQHVPQPAQLRGPRVIRMEKPDPVAPPRRPATSAPRYRQTTLSNMTAPPAIPASELPARGKRAKTYKSEELDEEAQRKRTARKSRGSDAGEQLLEWRDRDLAERQDRLKHATGRKAKRRATETSAAVVHKEITRAQVSEPIILKDFCAATGLSVAQLSPKLVSEFKILPNINMALERDTAQLLASEFGIELTVVAAPSPLDDIRDEFKKRLRPNLTHRAPVVVVLGHVDHGKTSLLDAIRQARVAAGEAGGITQHMGSYHLERDGLAVTFLDTPGHEAFTAMRARGAQMTDVAVLVVAADDGVMPQTIEAINHAKAAGNVAVVVALNKIDLPGVDTNKIYGQLSEHGLTPTEWGGSIDVIKTSATKDIGIPELISHLSTLSDVLDLKADPTIPACGRVIDSQMKPGIGAVTRILIQDGTLHRGDVLVCGPGFGKVRSMHDDQMRELKQAGPSMPVEISGLDELPAAGDEFYQVESLKRAEEIAMEVKTLRRRASLSTFNKPKTLEDLFGQKKAGQIPELNVIVKADVQGSVDVLIKTLGEFPSDQVKLKVLHSGVGSVSQSDVLLAEASRAVIIGFQVVADSNVRRLAEEKQVDIRSYRVIYDVLDDIKKALEGLLTPEEKFESRGQAEVRDTFKVSRVGTIAGCFLKEGVIARNHRVKVIRNGVIIRDNAELQSLKRFKDDVKEVKLGYECGIKINGFDDIKPGDIIESFEVIKIARKL